MLLQTLWFFLWGLLWAIFFMTDGFDFGIGILYPILGKTERDKRMMIHALGPFWDGNEVWLITAAGVTFAAFPIFYSVMFSTLYSPIMIILFSLIIRGVSFEFRNKVENRLWKKAWDFSIFIGSFIPTLVFGIVFANIFKGIPIDQNGIYYGNFITFLNPYGILTGGLFISLFMIHGAIWLIIKSDGSLKIRSEEIALRLWPILICFYVFFLIATGLFTDLYDNYIKFPVLILIMVGNVSSLISIKYYLMKKIFMKAWLASAGTILGCILFGITGLFPTLFKSSINEVYNLNAFNSSSSPLTLKIMLAVVIIFIPLVMGYQLLTYNFFKTTITDEELNNTNMY